MENVLVGLIPLILIILGFVAGKYIEKQHLRSLAQKEAALRGIGVCNLRKFPVGLRCQRSFLVTGSVVIATDRFKVFAASLRKLFGGEIRTYRSLMERARREALARMLDEAKRAGADSVWNVRLETATIHGKRRVGGVEVLAYGTAVKTS
ncbi:MAG: YbjQ family protein [Planctomycetota bacterium]|jgi:uncharacterized protein YbjQ (UPF0145 family)